MLKKYNLTLELACIDITIGVYQCRVGTITNGDVKEEIKEENYIAVHDVGKMEYLFKALGQLEGKYNVVSKCL